MNIDGKKKNLFFIIVVLVFSIILFFIPSNNVEKETHNIFRGKAEVVEVDNTYLNHVGVIKTGNQNLKVKMKNTRFKDEIIETSNYMQGKLELDKFFEVGDYTFVVGEADDDGSISYLNVIDHYRIKIEMILLILFIVLLIVYAGLTGLKAVLSFMFTILTIWKVLIPGFLNGYNPLIFALVIVALFTFVIVFLIAGLTKKGIVTFISSMSGVLLTCFLSVIFGRLFKVHGAVKPFAETLLHAHSHIDLDLTAIFLSGIFIASSGAVMDIAMDISASMEEIIAKKPEISRSQIILSGFKIGRAVIGTMTTTLLLAYTGNFTTILMAFSSLGTPVVNVLNINYVAAEILHTLVGSFGLITVAPITAVVGGLIYTSHPFDSQYAIGQKKK